ncbi:MAG: protein kinase [Thermoguttaceae bacterium]|nr:protein kinase [Thermoguttaceae bacterium]MDW8079625.1 protein kinase [Thermoguttaceae bacterium]
MPGLTASELADAAFDMGLLSERQLQEIWAHFGSHAVSLDALVQHLIRRGLLTNYQVDLLLKGKRTGFFYGDYKVLYMVGAGTFARVFRAVHRETGQVVAVKVLRQRFSDNEKMVSRFLREGEIGKTLQHPNIVPVYEVQSIAGTHFLVMEFVEGNTLRDFVKIRKKLDPLQATKLMIDMTQGLRYAFERGVAHRDLKMTNVLVSAKGQAKLVDFGLAAMEEEESPDRTLNMRALDYLALEMAGGGQKGDPRSDIYFLGCIYYNMLIGRWPLSEPRDRNQRLGKRRFIEVLPIQDVDKTIPRCVAIVVNKAMQVNPDRRYQTPSEMLFDLGLAHRELSGEAVEERQLAARIEEQTAAEHAPSAETTTAKQVGIMVVEANIKMQDIFREGLKRAGYRVLIISDPERALERLAYEPQVAQCVIINAQDIGQPAVAAFNRLEEIEGAADRPAILLVDETQTYLLDEVKTGPKRIVQTLPITLGKLRGLVAELLQRED